MYESPDGTTQRQAACETVGSTVRDVWSTTPEVRQSVVLWKADGREQDEVDEFKGSVGSTWWSLGVSFPQPKGYAFPFPPCTCHHSTRANGSTDVLLGDPLGGVVPFLVGLGELNGPRRPDAGSGTGGSAAGVLET